MRGEVLSLAQAWALASAWYADYLDPGFRGHTAAQAAAIFAAAGLSGPFWQTGPADDRLWYPGRSA